jgi:hypothetical protein
VNSSVDFDDMGDVGAGMELKGYEAGKIVSADN